MNLNRISIGGGLALVAVALLANAAASLVGTPDTIAYADKMKRADRRQQQEPVADVVVPSQEEGGVETIAGTSGGCVEVAPQQWFGAIRRIGTCDPHNTDDYSAPGRMLLPYADVNGDGVSERFGLDGRPFIWIVPVPDCQIWLETPVLDGDELSVERSCILSSSQLASFMYQQGGATNLCEIRLDVSDRAEWPGWSDVDGDGDLDLLLTIRNGTYGRLGVWLENTGFEKQQFAAGDINQDGNVDGVDISILLSDWSY